MSQGVHVKIDLFSFPKDNKRKGQLYTIETRKASDRSINSSSDCELEEYPRFPVDVDRERGMDPDLLFFFFLKVKVGVSPSFFQGEFSRMIC